MIRSISDRTTRDIYDGIPSKRARRFPIELREKAERLLDLLNAAADLKDLAAPPGNRLEALKGDLKGFHSIRVNDQWRIVFRWVDGDAFDVRFVDYH